jgi:hypothetical protein
MQGARNFSKAAVFSKENFTAAVEQASLAVHPDSKAIRRM